MGSEDVFHKEHPEANEAMMADLPPQLQRSFALARHSATSPQARRPVTARTVLSAHIQRLARKLGVSAEDLASRIPDDTIRRTKYPVTEKVQPDGSTIFEAPPTVQEGVRGLHHR